MVLPLLLRSASRIGLSPALACAALASSLLHASLLFVLLPPGPAKSVPGALPALQAQLTAVPLVSDSRTEFVPPTIDFPARSEIPGLARLDRAQLHLPALKPTQLTEVTPAPELAPAGGGVGDGFVSAQPLADMSRLGDLLARAQTDFPSEVSFPVRLNGEISARYPVAALAQGIEGNVVAWVVVDTVGKVEQIEFAEGDEVFRDAVREAIEKGRYYPAALFGQGLSFPIALEFHFELAAPALQAETATKR